MKKALIAVLAAVSLLFAESYQVNTLSAKQTGMAHTGAGIKLGSESMNFNPGGLGFLNKTLDVSAGTAIVIPNVEIKGKYGTADNSEVEIPFYFYAASRIKDWVSAGLSFTTPYGNSVDYGKSWEGADLVQNTSLSVYALQPTAALKPISQLSIGIGPVLYFGSYELNKRLLPPGHVNKEPTASAKISGNADLALAVNAGILYEAIPDKLALGVGYRSKSKMKLDVETEITSNSSTIVAGGDGGTFKTELPLPTNLNTGVSYRPMDRLLLAFDWQWVFWSAYSFWTSYSKKEYHDTFAYRLGAQYALMDELDVRLGAYYDESPVDDKYITPEYPSTDKLGLTTGVSYRPMYGLSIDASLLFATGFGSRGATSEKSGNGGLDGSYKAMVWAPSVGVSYSF